jgi:hypothetical protein
VKLTLDVNKIKNILSLEAVFAFGLAKDQKEPAGKGFKRR